MPSAESSIPSISELSQKDTKTEPTKSSKELVPPAAVKQDDTPKLNPSAKLSLPSKKK
jgi:hypothetical protein